MFESKKLEGENIVFTGKMQYKRDEMMEKARECGAEPQKNMNKKTSLLVMGEDVGQKKIDFAEKNNIEMISENQFWQMINGL